MIEELRVYAFRPNGLAPYLPLAAQGLAVRGPTLGTLVGFWLARRGTQDVGVHLWRYESLDHRQRVRDALRIHPRWNTEFAGRIMPLLESQEVRFLAPESQPMTTDSAGLPYCLHTCEAAPGSAAALLDSLRNAFAGNTGDVQIYSGISPWPNSVTVLARGQAALRLPDLAASCRAREQFHMRPAHFSPLQ